MLSASAESMAESLYQYGEHEAADWVVSCSDDELVRVCSVAEWLLYQGPGPSRGGSMMIARACAIAAVYVREGAPRELARSRRKRVAGALPVPSPGRRPNAGLQAACPSGYGVGEDLRAFWGA